MPSKRRTLPLNLTGKPAIRQVGLRTHGYAPSETFRLHGCWALHLYRYTGGLSFDGGHYPIRTAVRLEIEQNQLVAEGG